MDRVKPGYSELIAAGFGRIPEPIHRFLKPDFLTGTSPVLAGLHHFDIAEDGRSYSRTPHVFYSSYQLHLPVTQRRTTIVLPQPELWPDEENVEPIAEVAGIVHELGHVLHEQIGLGLLVDPVTRYAQRNHYEAFAEAFTSWLFPGYYPVPPDEKALALFEQLAER